MTLVHMDKICIVRRRMPEGVSEHGVVRRTSFYTLQRPQHRKVEPSVSEALGYRWAAPAFTDGSRQRDPGLSIELTPAQGQLVRSHPYFKLLAATTTKKSGIALAQENDGKIVLHIQPTLFSIATMLTTQDVMTVLRVSKNFVSKLVKSGELKSYKMGRLRRFLLEDVLSFLTDSKESF